MRLACCLFAFASIVVAPGCGGNGSRSDADAEEDAIDDATEQEGEDTDADEEDAWPPLLPEGIHELATIDPAAPTDDLTPLADSIGDAAVVALGESVHNSGGYLVAKHRLIRYLVENEGFRVVAFETDWTEAQEVTDYVDTCTGDPTEAVIAGMRDIWWSATIRDLIAWMCEYNGLHPGDPVHFFGFNNFNAWYDVPALVDFLGVAMPADAARLQASLERCEGGTSGSEEAYDATFSGTVNAEDYSACSAAVDEMDAYIAAHRTEVETAVGGATELEWVLVHLVGLRGWEDYQMYNPLPAGLDSRDEAMAYIFTKFREIVYPGEKVVMSLHSLHANTSSDIMDCVYPPTGASYDYWEGATRMGNHLADALGDDYFPVSLVSYRFAIFDAWIAELPDEMDVPAGPEIVEVMLHGLGRDTLLVDLAFPGASDPFLEAGATYRLLYAMSSDIVGVFDTVPGAQFRALVFLDESGPFDSL